MRRAAILIVCSIPVLLGGCLSANAPRQPPPQAAPQPSADTPGVIVNAPSATVRQVIADNARARGAKIAANEPRGIVLEGELKSSPPLLEEACGKHVPGRKQRIVLETQETPQGTFLSDRRFIVDGDNVCPLKLTPSEFSEATKRLNATKQAAEQKVAQR